MASVKPVRVVLFEKGVDGAEAPDSQMVIDMALDPETGASKGPFPAFGRIGNWQKPATLYPFALMMDGRLDFGTMATEAQNQEKLELRPARLEAGVEVPGTAKSYVIQSVTSLSGD